MERKKKRVSAADIARILVTALFLAGMMTVFRPCGPKADGSFMNCHRAGEAVRNIAAALLVLSVLHAAPAGRTVKNCLSCGMILLSLAAAFIPGHVIGLCMMPEMRCRLLTQPAAVVFSVVTAVLAAADLWAGIRQKKGQE